MYAHLCGLWPWLLLDCFKTRPYCFYMYMYMYMYMYTCVHVRTASPAAGPVEVGTVAGAVNSSVKCGDRLRLK